jgi:hypothetical protein
MLREKELEGTVTQTKEGFSERRAGIERSNRRIESI